MPTKQLLKSRSHRFVATAVLCVTLCNLGGYRPLTTHEVYVAQTAREMLAAGDWLVPRCFDEVRLKKPPLAYWQAMISYELTGRIDEWSARLPSALAGILQTGIIAVLATRLHGGRCGLLAGFIHATSVHFLTQARLAEVDASLALTTTAAFAALFWPENETRAWRAWVFWMAAALSLLAKGPVGPAIIAAATVCHWLCQRCYFGTATDYPCQQDTGEVSGKRKGTAKVGATHSLLRLIPMLLALCLAVAWPIALIAQSPEAMSIWWNESVGRFARDPNDIERHAFYYPMALFWLMLPWTPLVIWGAWRLVRRPSPNSLSLFAWLIGPMLLLSASAGKQEHYLIPALPPCSIWAALGARRLAAILRRRHSSIGLALPGTAVVACIVAVESLLLPRLNDKHRIVDWCRQLPRGSNQKSVALVGHSVWWTAFYLDLPCRKFDSAESFAANSSAIADDTLVVATLAHFERLASLPAFRSTKVDAIVQTTSERQGYRAARFAKADRTNQVSVRNRDITAN